MGQGPSLGDLKDLRCGGTKYFTKFNARSGNLVDLIGMTCNDGTYMEQGGQGGKWGDNDDFVCDSGFNEVRVRAGANVDQIQFKCSDERWSKARGGTGGVEYHKKCDGTQVITGLRNLGKLDNKLALGGEFSQIVECGEKIDCLADANLFNTICKNRTDTVYQNKVSEFCNRNDANAKSDGCINWCNDNRSRCTLLNDLNDCVKYGITRGECSRSRINDVEAECKKYRLIVSDVGATGMYPCNPSSLNKLREDCKELGIEDSSCSPDALEPARDRKLQMELDEQLRKEAQERYEETQRKAAERYAQTQAMIAQTMGVQLPTETPMSAPTEKTQPTDLTDDQQLYIIIAIIVCLLLSSSLISIVFLLPE